MNSFIKNNALTLLLGLLVTTIIGFFLIRTVSEYDIWFHLAIGKEILRSRSIPVVDQFSLLSLGRPYHDSQWLFQVIVAAGHHLVGFWWLHAVQVGFWGLALGFVYSACRVWSPAFGAWLLVLVTALACEERFTIRPELVSYLAVALFYYLLQQRSYRSRSGLLVLGFMQVLWTNCHGVYVIGPFLVGCYFVEALFNWWRRKDHTDLRDLSILLSVVLVGCLVTPYGLNGLKFAWLLMVQVSPAGSKLYKLIYDNAHPLGESSRATTAFWFYFTLLTGWGITLLAVLWNRKSDLPLARTLIVAGMLAASMTGIRNLPLFALVAAPIIAEYMSLLQMPLIRKLCVAATGTSLVGTMLFWSPRPAWEHFVNWVPYRFGIGLSPDYVPLTLPQFLDQLKFTGPVFNSQTLGGFYEFHGYPRRIPFFDGRLEAYKPENLLEVYEAAAKATTQPALWNDLMRRYDFRGLLVENGSPDADGLLPTIARSQQWRLVYLDFAASFWLRADYPVQPREVDDAAVAALVERVDSFANVENLFLFLDRAAMYPELRRKLIERASQRWENQFTLKNLGLLQMQTGDLELADRTFRRLLKLTPRSRSTLTTLAQIALARGDRMSAEKYLLQGLDLFPEDATMRENLEIIRSSGQ